MLGLPRDEWLTLAKRTLVACDGHVRNAAEILGLKYKALSGALNRGELATWWLPYKRRLMADRAHARHRRAYERRKVRAFVESGVPLIVAEDLAKRRAPREGWGTALQGSPEADVLGEGVEAAPAPRKKARRKRKRKGKGKRAGEGKRAGRDLLERPDRLF